MTAKGGTDYGPFTADVLVRPSPRLTVDVNRLVFAGIVGQGRIAATPAGPFAGALQFAGRGITGNVRLADQGGYQRADVAARAFNATIPGQSDFTIGRAIVNASVVMVPKAPQVVADVQVGDTRYNAFVIQAMRAKVNYAGGRGTAQAVLNGSSGVPLRLAINARLSPDAYLVAAQGQANGIRSAPERRRGSLRLAVSIRWRRRGSISARAPTPVRRALRDRSAAAYRGAGAARLAQPVDPVGVRAEPGRIGRRHRQPRLSSAGAGDPGGRRAADDRQFPAHRPVGRVRTGRRAGDRQAAARWWRDAGAREAWADGDRSPARDAAAAAAGRRIVDDAADAGAARWRHPL